MAKPKILQQLNAEAASKILLAAEPVQTMEAVNLGKLDTEIGKLDTGVVSVNGEKGAISNVAKTTGTSFTGSVEANGASSLTTGQVRNIYCSTAEPTASDGSVGDIWVVYEE